MAFIRSTGDADATPTAALYGGKKEIAVPLDQNWAQLEVLWSPDSQTVALTGAFNAYTNSTMIFRLLDEKLGQVPLQGLQKDMASVFRPAKGRMQTK